nr:ribonuclease H-like domain-containing protein [Tanacetum cinerariifolium]
MDQDSVHMVAASKVPMLKPGEYELWRIRMEQYIQMVDYSLWEVIENGNAPPITQVVETTIVFATAKEKAQRRLELKARSTLLMGIPNEHQLKFNSIKDAKSLLQAVKKRFGGNAATKKTQRNLLKQQYENFTASSSEVRDGFKVTDGYANNESKEILGEHWKEVFLNGNETNGFDKSKVECCNCHKKGHLARECRALRSQDTKHKESTRRIVPVETLLPNFLHLKPDLSGLEEFVNEPIVIEPTAKKPIVESSKAKASADKPKVERKDFGPSLIKDWISDSEDESESKPKIEKKTVKPSFAKIKFVKSKEQVSTAHLKSIVNVARPNSRLSNTAHSTVKRLINKKTTFTNSNVPLKVNIVRSKTVNTARPKAIVSAVLENRVNVVKASACWVWKPKTKGNPQMDLQDKGVIDSGYSRYMTGNMSYLLDYKEINEGYVAFGGNPKGRKITGR